MSDYTDKINELLKNTDFEVMVNSKILTSRKKIRTPLEALNCLLGGGMPLGIVAHIWGEPRAAKSTILYQMMGYFQKDYPDGIAIIVDMESSADPARLSALGVDVDKVVRLPATSIESGFISLLKLLENKRNTEGLKDLPIFVIWDTISKGLATDTTIQSRVMAMDKARIIKNYLGQLTKEIEKQDFFLGLLNQVIYTTDRYGNRKASYGGGIALNHENQISIQMALNSDDFNDYNMLVRRTGKANIDKSKISPEVRGIPYVIDIANGTVIDQRKSFIDYLWSINWIDPGNHGWYKMEHAAKSELSDQLTSKLIETYFDIYKKRRWADFVDEMNSSDLFIELGKHVVMSLIERQYSLQADVVRDYHLKTLDKIKELVLKDGKMSEDEFELLANGVIPEESDGDKLDG